MMLGMCPGCVRDYDPEHHPNNLDCPRYREVVIVIYEVKEGPIAQLVRAAHS